MVEALRREVILYVNLVVEERLANDPYRLNAFRNLAVYIYDNHRNCTPAQRLEMIRQMFGDHNKDLTQIYFPVVQEQYEQGLRLAPPEVQTSRLHKLAKMCYCVQFMDLYRQCFPMDSPAYSILYNAVERFIPGDIPETQLCDHLGQVLLQFPDFRNQLEARVNRLTPLFK